MLTYRYPRTLSSDLLKCRRISVRNFCNEVKLIKEILDSNKTRVSIETKLVYDSVKKETKNLITSGDLNKEIIVYSSNSSIGDMINKLSTFKIDKCGKYINLTKKFLCDSNFLKLAYHMIKNRSGINAKSIDDDINVE
jgi:hypothetical protein